MKETRAKAERQVRRPLHKGKIYPFECRVPRIARRDKKAFLSNQCKEIEENNRMGAVDKNLPASAGDTGSIPGPGRFHVPWSN